MFNSNAEKYLPKHLELANKYKAIEVTKSENCLKAGNTEVTIRESFRFIKEKEDSLEIEPRNVRILMGAWVTKDQNNYNNDLNSTFTMISGVITKVCESYAELLYENSKGEMIKTVVSYGGIVDFNHSIINEYFDEYINRIDAFPPLCKDDFDGNYKLLERLSNLIMPPNDTSNYRFVLDGVLTRVFEAKNIVILRNLIILEEFIVIPVTSISGFLQAGKCDK